MSTIRPSGDVQAIMRRSRELDALYVKYGADQERQRLARELMQDAAKAGAVTYSDLDRNRLRGVLDYWASVLRIAYEVQRVPTEEIVLPPALKRYTGTTADTRELPTISREEFIRRVRAGEQVHDVRVAGADFSEMDFERVRILNSRFVECNFRQVRFAPKSEVLYTSFVDCDLRNMMAWEIHASNSNFEGSNLDDTQLRRSELDGVTFTEARISRADFNDCKLSNAVLRNVRGEDTRFRDATMILADLSLAVLYRADFHNASLIKAQLQQADFTEADFEGAYLNEADVEGTKFIRAKLHRASFQRIENIHDAIWTGSNWQAADLPAAGAKWLELHEGQVAAGDANETKGPIAFDEYQRRAQ